MIFWPIPIDVEESSSNPHTIAQIEEEFERKGGKREYVHVCRV